MIEASGQPGDIRRACRKDAEEGRQRGGGDIVGGPPPFSKADRSRFLQALDEALVRLEQRQVNPF